MARMMVTQLGFVPELGQISWSGGGGGMMATQVGSATVPNEFGLKTVVMLLLVAAAVVLRFQQHAGLWRRCSISHCVPSSTQPAT